MFGDWMEKYEHIISLGKELAPLDPEDKVEDNLIKGCQSRVWLAAKKGDDGRVMFTADSDAIITKGLAALMVRVLSDASAADIASSTVYGCRPNRLAAPPEHLVTCAWWAHII